ncbi:uncharacterized protein LOC108835054, partial [Raphanus sativus]|uniref:Uncharacterized protein LOC108835054 n=1 Tax=Raphanus sativus TaxID=3726 RepID=A0A9W3D032_RAPSA
MGTAGPPILPDSPTGARDDQETRSTSTNHGEAVTEGNLEKIIEAKEIGVESDDSKVVQKAVVDVSTDDSKDDSKEDRAAGTKLRLEERTIEGYKEGQKIVEIPNEIIENANQLFDDFLIGKFLDSAPHIARVHAIVNRIWNQGDGFQKIEVFAVDSTTMKFKVLNPLMRSRILKRGMWNIGNIPLVVTKWTPEELEEKPEVKSIPLWVHLKNVPLHMFSWEGLSFIASAAGFPVRLHPETASCSNFKLAKIFVNADLSKELPTKINFTKDGKSSLVEFIYPWLPLRCNTCSKWGHTEKSCVMNKKDGVSLEEHIQKSMEKVTEGQEKKVDGKDPVIELVESEEGKEKRADIRDMEIEEGQIREDWSDVNSGRKRSPTKRMLEYGQVQLLTPSRFQILDQISEKGDLLNQKNKEETEQGESFESVWAVIEEVRVEEDKGDEEMNDTQKNEEGKNNEVDAEEMVEEINLNEDVTKEEDKKRKKRKEEEEEQREVVKSPTYCEIVRSENGKEAPRTTKPDPANVIQPSLPRNSKTYHKVVPENHLPGNQGRKGNQTRVKENKAKQIVSSVFNGWSWINNYEFSRKGRIWVMWSPHTRITPVFSSSQIITVSVLLEGEEEEFFCSFVYGENLMEDRKDLWRDIKDHQNSAMFRGKPWIIMGDFNEIIDGEEHSNYQDSGLINEGMRDFEHVIQYCHFMDLGSQGPKFTWCNKRKEGLICKKLDRFLVNDIWLHKQDKSYGVFEAGGCSDHLRGRFHLQAEAIGKRRPFKFTNAVAEMSEFIKLIEDFWKSNQPLFQSTSALFRFSKSLKALKPLIKKLSKEKLGKLSLRVKEAYNDLCKHQERLMDDPNLMNIQEELTMEERWLIISAIEEKVLKQRAKLHWLQLGDGNNKVFHNAVKIREARNAIREIRCQSGEVVTTQEGIKNEAEKFFSEFLSFEPPEVQEISVEELQNFLSFRCSNEEKSKLIKPVTEEEIKEVVFKMPNNKSPGPDGYTTEFFKASWSVIGKDLVIAIQSFFSKGFLPKGLNSTILALVAKKDKAIEMRDYRPISCCNVIYKSAFVKDRLLVENLLLATEIVKDYHKEDVSPRCAMKIDIAKAFDSVHWPFLLNTLRALNMPEEFVHWIELCGCTPSFSVQVNGELAGFFQSKRGLRQGCALSPYLFVICMNVLSHLLDKAAAQKVIGYHPKCQNILLTHLCFADDLLVFTDGTKRSIENVLKIFEDFAAISGLKISLEKSTLFTAGLSEAQE